METKEELNHLKAECKNNLQALSEDELNGVVGGAYTGSYRFELDQRVREKAGLRRIGKISEHDGLANREAYVVWFSSQDYPDHWGYYHCYAEELEPV